MDKRTKPSSNESEYGTPQVSYYGQMLRAAQYSLINDGQYLPGPFHFKRFFGNVSQRSARVVPIKHISGYAGDVSLKYQPEIQKKPSFAR